MLGEGEEVGIREMCQVSSKTLRSCKGFLIKGPLTGLVAKSGVDFLEM